MTAPLLDIDVIGTPRPKGSLKPVGHGRLVETLKHSPDWRHAVVVAAFAQVSTSDETLRDGYPETGPVKVDICLRLRQAKSNKSPWPTGRNTGDSDKHARNIFDALQDSGVIKDDAQVVLHEVEKRWCKPGEVPGAHIVVRRLP